MSMMEPNEAVCRFAEVYTTAATGRVFGHRITGASAGPQLVVAGHGTAAMQVFLRLMAIPTLPWMRGRLVLIQLDAMDDLIHDISGLTSLGPVDRTMILADANGPDANGADDGLLHRNYHLVLGVCTQLGMISGRGVTAAKSLEPCS